jgi:hypothetical protein|tara:strand:- start:1292 stop:1570 length:279 start_codon:yes stop_codon:yes gene_type:complete
LWTAETPVFGEHKKPRKKNEGGVEKEPKTRGQNLPKRGKKAPKAPKKEGQNKKKDATIEFFGDARADGRRNNQYRPKKEERRARRKKRRTFR